MKPVGTTFPLGILHCCVFGGQEPVWHNMQIVRMRGRVVYSRALDHGCTAQLVFVPFLMGILEVGPTPRRPSSSSTAAVADVVPQNGLSLVAGSRRQFDTARARWRPEPRLHGSASVCTAPDGHFGGCVRAAGPQQQRYRCSGSQRTQIRLESALYQRSTSILARSSRNGPLGAVSLATLGDKTAVRPVNDPIIPRDSAAHPRGEWPRGALDRAAHRHRVRNQTMHKRSHT